MQDDGEVIPYRYHISHFVPYSLLIQKQKVIKSSTQTLSDKESRMSGPPCTFTGYTVKQ